MTSRILLAFSSLLTDPICWCSSAFYRIRSPLLANESDFAVTKTKEVFERVKLALGAAAIFVPIAIPLAALAKPIRWLGFFLQKGGFTHVQGSAFEKTISSDKHYTLMNWNVIGIGGGMSRDHGGTSDWPKRLDRIIEKIRTLDPDVLVLEEIYDAGFGEALIAKLKDLYPHFYFHMGPALWGSVSGIFVASKFPVHDASFTAFHNNTIFDSQKGFFSFAIQLNERSVTRIVATHLQWAQRGKYEQNAATRMKQVAEITHHLALKKLFPTIVMGDLNLERDSKEAEKVLNFLEPGYVGKEPTCTNQFIRKIWDSNEPEEQEWIDYISPVKNTFPKGSTIQVDLIRAHDGNDSRTVLSDHHALFARVYPAGT